MSLTDTLRSAWARSPFDGLFSPDYVRHSGDDSMDRDGFEKVMGELHDAFPDLTFEIVDTVEQGDRVAYRWESTGTHSGSYLGVLPTHKRVIARGMTISRFEGEQVVEEWTSWDKASVLASLGILQLR